MAERNRPHILLTRRAVVEPYRRPNRKITGRSIPVPADPQAHGQSLRDQLESAADEGSRRRQESVEVRGAVPGIHVVFESFPGIELLFEKLDPRAGKVHPELLSVREITIAGQRIEQAVVFIPEGKLGYFLRRIDKYLATAQQEKPANRDLINRVRAISLASLEELWTDAAAFPAADEEVWWEVWLRRRDNNEIDRLRSFAAQVGAQVSTQVLAFPDRLVVLVKAMNIQLAGAVDVLDDLAELRRPRELAQLLALEPAIDQATWLEDLRNRTMPASAESPAVCVVDTGVQQGHPLLAHSLATADCHACDPNWHTQDHHGHGTEMAGIALYGDLGQALMSNEPIYLRHRLESVKYLPPVGANPPELWGAITATAASLVEIQEPQIRRVFSIATTAQCDAVTDEVAPSAVTGQPSSWSAAIDALAAGLAIDVTDDGMVFLDDEGQSGHRLFLISSGNVRTFDDDFLSRSDLEPVEDPGQSWNALTVGAFTELTVIDSGESGYDGWTALADRGELSPYSRTSVTFQRIWPIKPDVVLEGGNIARSPDGSEYDSPYSFQRLTTKAQIRDQRVFTVTCATSAATAQAAHLATSILADYPRLWSETVRALVVHSAEWTAAMRCRMDRAQGRAAITALYRRYGMGVPDYVRATRSATDALTLVVEDAIRPFDGEGRMREMHLHDLPWPTDVLSDLGEARVRLRVTLSYFVEPNPGRRGWVRRYSYASHGLRFDVRRPTESNDEFRKRINQLARQEEERRPTTQSDAQQWIFGPDQRAVGSLHTDIWHGTAADLAQRGAVAVFPVAGWWKERPNHDRSERGVRYALVLSIETPDQDVDIWTPVAQEVGLPVNITI